MKHQHVTQPYVSVSNACPTLEEMCPQKKSRKKFLDTSLTRYRHANPTQHTQLNRLPLCLAMSAACQVIEIHHGFLYLWFLRNADGEWLNGFRGEAVLSPSSNSILLRVEIFKNQLFLGTMHWDIARGYRLRLMGTILHSLGQQKLLWAEVMRNCRSFSLLYFHRYW